MGLFMGMTKEGHMYLSDIFADSAGAYFLQELLQTYYTSTAFVKAGYNTCTGHDTYTSMSKI